MIRPALTPGHQLRSEPRIPDPQRFQGANGQPSWSPIAPFRRTLRTGGHFTSGPSVSGNADQSIATLPGHAGGVRDDLGPLSGPGKQRHFAGR